MSSKELGQIHSVVDNATLTSAAVGTVARRVDLADELTQQLQRMVRQGNFFKLVGVDLAIRPNVSSPVAGDGGTLNGYSRYYTPTRGRCAAFRGAFKAMADQMKMQGISMRDNHGYDFRVALSNIAAGPNIRNQASLDGTNGLSLYSPGVPGASIFEVHNSGVKPNQNDSAVGVDQFSEGYDTVLQSGAGKTDFVLNDQVMFTYNEDFASTEFQEIPFQLVYSYGSTNTSTLSFQWRPDPALYVAVMTGNLEIVVNDMDLSGSATALILESTFYVAGWKSIMGSPDKKKKSGRRSKKKR